MKPYIALLNRIFSEGEVREDRTGVGTISVFGAQAEFSLDPYFPLLDLRRLHTKSIVHELLWMISGKTNIKYLKDNGVSIWDEWANEDGDLGPVYGAQWRYWLSARKATQFLTDAGHPSVTFGTIDQLANVVESINKNPFSRRHIVTAWNPDDIEACALPPCHCFFQFYVGQNSTLSCHLYMRSADVYLGVPFNIASYALLTSMIARLTGLKPSKLVMSFGDLHLYKNHVEQALLVMDRAEVRPENKTRLVLRSPSVDPATISDFRYEDISFVDYSPAPALTAPVAK